MTACAYRSLEPVLVQRLRELRARREHDAVLVEVARRVAARRIGRALGGCVGVAMGGGAFLVALASLLAEHPAVEDERAAATALLLLAWPAAIVVAVVARALARRVLAWDVHVTMTGRAAEDLARLEARDPLRETVATAMAWERRAAALPLAALSLLAPLTIHWLVYWPFSTGHSFAGAVEDFGTWVTMSVVIVGHAHLALLVAAVCWASKLRTVPTDLLRFDLNRAWGRALLVSAAVACIPGVVLIGIPPVLVALTGLCFVPFMYVATVRILTTERTALESTQPA